MSADQKDFYPECFGVLKNVFPMGGDGLRHSPETCMPCAHKTICLKKAIGQKDGFTLREEVVDRAYASGLIGFWQRWSRKKNLQRRISESSAAPQSEGTSKRSKP